MTYFDSADSGAVIVCDQDSNAITLRIVTPIVVGDESVTDRPIWMGAIVDKNEAHLGFGHAIVTKIGNLAFDLNLEDESAARFLHEMKNGQSKLYVKIHEEGDPLSYALDGSTRASKQAIPYCLTKGFSND
ncbi:hypothetical protein [uncultured Martelella sp.]|uniref:hypothetical protein n=1 Tax=uncultured Martelella sp. TaxID=392331 RepID=UPI0029C61F7A|nr:hypothetical protein [uncultured Martelella sp.]